VADHVRPRTPRGACTPTMAWPIEPAHGQEGRAPAAHSRPFPLPFSFPHKHSRSGASSCCNATAAPPCPLTAAVVSPSNSSRHQLRHLHLHPLPLLLPLQRAGLVRPPFSSSPPWTSPEFLCVGAHRGPTSLAHLASSCLA
jgi:hypothetical protein